MSRLRSGLAEMNKPSKMEDIPTFAAYSFLKNIRNPDEYSNEDIVDILLHAIKNQSEGGMSPEERKLYIKDLQFYTNINLDEYKTVDLLEMCIDSLYDYIFEKK